MKKSIVKTLSAFLALVLILSILPMAAFAAEHIHNYNVTTTIGYEWYSNYEHTKVETHKHLCDCGEVFYENHRENGAHAALPGSGVNLGSYMGDDGSTITTYRYTCKACGFTYTRSVAS